MYGVYQAFSLDYLTKATKAKRTNHGPSLAVMSSSLQAQAKDLVTIDREAMFIDCTIIWYEE